MFTSSLGKVWFHMTKFSPTRWLCQSCIPSSNSIWSRFAHLLRDLNVNNNFIPTYGKCRQDCLARCVGLVGFDLKQKFVCLSGLALRSFASSCIVQISYEIYHGIYGQGNRHEEANTILRSSLIVVKSNIVWVLVETQIRQVTSSKSYIGWDDGHNVIIILWNCHEQT